MAIGVQEVEDAPRGTQEQPPSDVPTTDKLAEAEKRLERNIHAMETGEANPDSEEVSASVYLSPGRRIAAPAIQQVEAGFERH